METITTTNPRDVLFTQKTHFFVVALNGTISHILFLFFIFYLNSADYQSNTRNSNACAFGEAAFVLGKSTKCHTSDVDEIFRLNVLQYTKVNQLSPRDRLQPTNVDIRTHLYARIQTQLRHKRHNQKHPKRKPPNRLATLAVMRHIRLYSSTFMYNKTI